MSDVDFDTDWTLIDFTEPKPAASKDTPKGCCPKCGRGIGRGSATHIKYCLGKTDQR